MSSENISVEVQSLIDAQDNPFVLIGENYSIVAANTAYKQAYGLTERDLVGYKCHQVLHNSDVPCHMNGEDCPHKRVFETRKPHQVLHIYYDIHAQPKHVRIKGSPVLGPNGEMFLGEAILPPEHTEDLDCEHQHLSNDLIEAWSNGTVTHLVDNSGHEPSMKSLESRYIAELLAEHQGKRSAVAQILGISERTLYRKLKQYGLQEIGRAGQASAPAAQL